MLDLANCTISLLLFLAPIGSNASTSENFQIGGVCTNLDIVPTVTEDAELSIKTKYLEFLIPLPQREDETYLSYRMGSEYAYLGDCRYGASPYYLPPIGNNAPSKCQKVQVRFGPKLPL